MIDSTLFNIFLHNLQCRNRCLRNFVIQTHYTIIPKSTLLQDRIGVFFIFVTRSHKRDPIATSNGNIPYNSSYLFQNFSHLL